jgi:hypothetical protein
VGVGIVGGSFGLGDHQCGAGISDAGDPDIKKAALNWRLWVCYERRSLTAGAYQRYQNREIGGVTFLAMPAC